jgi:thiamine pyrophosphate-dependent acetolactate synthase large subunit-like protein
MAKRVADVIVETLQAAGVKRCWGVPGDTLNFVTVEARGYVARYPSRPTSSASELPHKR